MAATGTPSVDSGYYHPLLIYGFWLEDEDYDVDWDRIYEAIDMLNCCVRSKESSSEDHLEPPGEL